MSRAEKLERLVELYELVSIVTTVEHLDSIYTDATIEVDLELLEDTMRNC